MRRKIFSKENSNKDITGLNVVILCGGRGKRLEGAIGNLPKSMAEINHRPFLDYLIRQASLAGLTDILLCTGYRAAVIKGYFGNGSNYNLRIRYSQERNLLGTAGALAHARDRIRSDPFMVMNGDSYCQVNFKKLIKQHRKNNALATIVTARLKDRYRYASIEIGSDKRIISFAEKRGGSGSGYVNAGIYLLSQKVLDLITYAKYSSIERDIFPALCRRGLYAFKASGIFIDIGIPRKLKRAEMVLNATGIY